MNIYDQYDARIACLDYFGDEDTPFTANQGLLTLCHEGDGMYSVLVVNSEDADTYGTVWYFGYVETVRLPEPPNRPDIMGRKMGWIE